ncbi:Polymyxin resistance protein ArnT, undecaprenyl phosphate-alpha-L-Ara4N transferase [Labilithrix luteola]|uniref:Polymyxin resistance protein ArnT, undecaprenyl phosphate-alpha-L-Ara4N transferase n=1 Tax=Labilithrix luteola TaxID=1391654 RepID=A0A0K1Q0M6_9BACT|nr:Polymyxin resistance protein ArnT, undecaprenyl phosphate-alpha-L-Ara4N transferase [Labilithrix luteola]
MLSAVVLLTMPGFAILAHQAITDMPLVAGVAGSVGMLVGASAISDSRESRGFIIRVMGRDFVLHGGHLVAALYAALVVPQLLVLLGAHVHVGSGALVWGRDRLLAGSPHACTLPGQPTCREIALAHPRLAPLAQAAFWLPVMAYTTLRIADTRRARNQWVIVAWLFAALATMSKGPAGLVIPVSAAAMLLAIRRSLRPLSWMELATGALVTLSLVGPWYVAAYARHGRSFIDELVMRNMLGRTLDHLHDTNGGDDVGITYFVKQLGYATLPWFGFALAALFSLSTGTRFGRKATAKAMMAGAFLVAFTLVSMMKTKFHHYVLVALPPCAALVGLWLDELWEEARTTTTRHDAARTLVILVLVAATTVLVGFDVVSVPNHFAKLMTYRYSRAWPSEAWTATVMGCFVGALSLAMVGVAVRRFRRRALIGCAVLSAAFAMFVLDVYWLRTGPLGGQRAVFDAYYRARADDSNRAELVAYQLNWKGENFYSGNDLAIFIQSGAPFRKYLEERKRHDAHVLYAVTETGRLSSLRSELGALRSFDVLTDATASPEFSLVRAVLAP